jgi:hypothetical protein
LDSITAVEAPQPESASTLWHVGNVCVSVEDCWYDSYEEPLLDGMHHYLWYGLCALRVIRGGWIFSGCYSISVYYYNAVQRGFKARRRVSDLFAMAFPSEVDPDFGTRGLIGAASAPSW